MKSIKLGYICALVGFVFVLSSPTIAQAHDYSGKWAINGVLGDPTIASIVGICDFTQDGHDIVGSCKGATGVGAMDGSEDDGKIQFELHIVATKESGVTAIAHFKGVLDPDGVVRGTWTMSTFPDAGGPFTAQKI